MSKDYSNKDLEIIDLDGTSINSPTSVFEKVSPIESYDDLVKQIGNLNIPEFLVDGNGKSYSHENGMQVWKIVILGAKPKPYRTEIENQGYIKVYKLLHALASIGEYPLMQLLTNYLGVSIDEFYGIVQNQTHPLREVYFWAMNVFEAAAQLNGVRANGNDAMRKWIDETREYKVKAEDQLNFQVEQNKIDFLKNAGAEIVRELIAGNPKDDKGGGD